MRVRSTRLVSFEHRHVVAVSYEVTMDERAPVIIRSRVVNRANPVAEGAEAEGARNDPRLGTRLGRRVLDALLVEQEGERLVLGYQTLQSGMTLAVVVDHVLDVSSPHQVSVNIDPDVRVRRGCRRRARLPVRLVKYAAYQSSRSVAVEELARRCRHARASPRPASKHW